MISVLMKKLLSKRCSVINIIRKSSSAFAETGCSPELDPPTNLSEGCTPNTARTALVLGVYEDEDMDPDAPFIPDPILTESGKKFDQMVCKQLTNSLRNAGPYPRLGEYRIFYNLEPNFNAVAVVGLGKECTGYNILERLDESKEAIRIGVAVGCRALQDLKPKKIFVEGFGDFECAAEGACLSIWTYQEHRNKAQQMHIPKIEPYECCDQVSWEIGLKKAAAQNLSRQLMDMPANLMTPTAFAHHAVDLLCRSGVNTEVKVKGWIETQKMGAFINIAKGSCEPPILLELSYYGAAYDERPVVLVGSGVTFDSGGLCFKSDEELLLMKGDLGGAACVISVIRAIALLRLPLNVRGLVPLCENLPGCLAAKPGDIVTSMSGKSILIDAMNNESRVLLADVLWYAQNFWPKFIIDIGTFTKSTRRGIGCVASGIWTNSDNLWDKIENAGIHTGDRVWRFPLWRYYTNQVTNQCSVDITNVGYGRGGDSCKAAAFLREFVPCGEWMHIDCYNTMWTNGKDIPYLRKGMSGRPTRTLIEFMAQLTCKLECKNN